MPGVKDRLSLKIGPRQCDKQTDQRQLDDDIMTYLEKTLEAIGSYAIAVALEEHCLRHTPEQALRHILLTCQQALAKERETEEEDGA